MKAKDGLMAVLERHGIKNAAKYLEQKGKTAKVGPSAAPDVRVRGSIQLMKKQKVSRAELDANFAKLKYL